VQEREAILQSLHHHPWREQLDACRRQLDGERQAIETHAELGHRLRILVGESKTWIDHLGPLQEEGHRGNLGELVQGRQVDGVGKGEGAAPAESAPPEGVAARDW
jgi:hypothetical protein